MTRRFLVQHRLSSIHSQQYTDTTYIFVSGSNGSLMPVFMLRSSRPASMTSRPGESVSGSASPKPQSRPTNGSPRPTQCSTRCQMEISFVTETFTLTT